MADLTTIFDELDYVDTITHVIDEVGLSVTVAEASVVRNRPFARKLAEVMAREEIDDATAMSPEGHIEIITETLLKDWDMKRDGAKVPVSEAREILTANVERGGHQISVHIELAASNSARFKAPKQDAVKKKRSSGTTPTTSRSATKPGSSPARRKAGASRSRKGSKAS